MTIRNRLPNGGRDPGRRRSHLNWLIWSLEARIPFRTQTPQIKSTRNAQMVQEGNSKPFRSKDGHDRMQGSGHKICTSAAREVWNLLVFFLIFCLAFGFIGPQGATHVLRRLSQGSALEALAAGD